MLSISELTELRKRGCKCCILSFRATNITTKSMVACRRVTRQRPRNKLYTTAVASQRLRKHTRTQQLHCNIVSRNVFVTIDGVEIGDSIY
jgi:hypothetical protein